MAVRTSDVRDLVIRRGLANRWEIIGFYVDTPPGSTEITIRTQGVKVDADGRRSPPTKLDDVHLTELADQTPLVAAMVRNIITQCAQGLDAQTRATILAAVLQINDGALMTAGYVGIRDALYDYQKRRGVIPSDAR